MIEKLARITSASLEIQDRGILNFWIMVEYEEGCGQGIGGLVLDTYDKTLKQRVGTAYGCEIIRQLLLCFNVNDFSEMKGKDIFVLGEGDGFGFNPKGVKALRADGGMSVIFDDVLKMFKE